MSYEEKAKLKVVIPRAKEVREASASKAMAPVTPRASVPAVAETNKQYRERYLAPQSIAGTEIKFSKGGEFVHKNNEAEKIGEDRRFIVLADQTIAGWIKFNGHGVVPDKQMGLYYSDDYRIPERQELGDLDQSRWELGPNGIDKQDPWGKQWMVVLQDEATSELSTFVTNTKTGHTAVSNLLRHYDRLILRKPNHYPVVKLVAGGFQHKDSRIGWVPTPVFCAVGSVPCDGAAKPPVDDPFNDDLPPNMKGGF
jgi:hypothetical protein